MILPTVVAMLAGLATSTSAPDLSKYKLTYSTTFSSLSIIQDCKGTIPCYGTPGHTWFSSIPNGFGPKEYSALSADVTGLHITATKDAAGKWHSGEVSSCDSSAPPKGFHQGYGYYEVKVREPVSTPSPTGGASGVWTSPWMTSDPKLSPFPPGNEWDIREYYGGRDPADGVQDGWWTTWHFTDPSGVRTSQGKHLFLPSHTSESAAYHVYGLDIEPDFSTMYADGVQLWQVASHSEFGLEHCFYFDYAFQIQLGWDGRISGSHYDVMYFKAYQRL